MKLITLEDNTLINCISTLEAQMLEIHVSGYLNNNIEINNGDTIVDVGANIGLFGHKLSSSYNDIRILGLEPIPDIYRVLQANVKLSENDKYTVYPYGVSDKNEFKKIIYYPNSTPMSTFNPDMWDDEQLLLAFEGTMDGAPKSWWWSKYVPRFLYPLIIFWLKINSKKIVCELKTLSYIINENNLNRIDLLKIDCEGNEMKTLNGIKTKHWPIIKQIIVEVHNIDNRLDRIRTLLKDKGFKIRILKETSLKKTNLVNIYAAR